MQDNNSFLMIVVMVLVVFAFQVAKYAEKKGLSYTQILILGLITTPIVAYIVTLIMASNTGRNQNINVSQGNAKKCPFCAESIKAEAIVCRFCNRDISPSKA